MSADFFITPITLNIAARLFPEDSYDTNKSRRGKSLILAGSDAHLGAGILSARAAARCGSGYVYLSPSLAIKERIQHPEIIFAQDPSELFETADAILVGPGYGVNRHTLKIIQHLIRIKAEAVILDADALTVCAEENLFPLPSSWILTPHEGELARLMKCKSSEVKSYRELWARKAQIKYQARIVLKGPGTLILSPNRTYQNTSGNNALAKAGSGDVLAGMITAFRAQGLSPLRAACLAVFVHGYGADLWVQGGKDPLSMTATDLVELLPQALMEIRSLTT
jgi:ADP-dependent NAD(P)H-hydrate dehydratase